MPSIWRNDGENWQVASPARYPNEAALHTLVEGAPQVLPLAGQPTLAILGREVRVGGGYADLVGIDTGGMPTVIEVKLGSNDESRRAVVTQVLSYAAALFQLSLREFEEDVLAPHLAKQGLTSIAQAVAPISNGRLDPAAFGATVEENLRIGRLRVVIVLDEALPELISLVGFLESVTEHLTIDLVTVSQYEISGETVVIPQRIDPGRIEPTRTSLPGKPGAGGQLTEGSAHFRESLLTAAPEARDRLERLVHWAEKLSADGLIRLQSYEGKGDIATLLPRLKDEGVGLVTVYRDTRTGYLQFWRNVMARRCPASLAAIEQAAGPAKVGQGTVTHEISDELLSALTRGYREAAQGPVAQS